uniref:Potassium calcium-activated channel subfamily M regulatory beta subunit 4 n=1 Tax=Poecilia mexicana TaxID=48701 RepID=A0A3B3Z499_9TELE
MAKIRVSYEYSEAEDKSIRLGLFLIACGILSLFILGFCWLSPTLQSLQSKPANCTVVSVLRPEEMFECVFTCGADCKGTSLYPCLQIFVNNSESNSVALLHFDEQQLVLNPKVNTSGSLRSNKTEKATPPIWLYFRHLKQKTNQYLLIRTDMKRLYCDAFFNIIAQPCINLVIMLQPV